MNPRNPSQHHYRPEMNPSRPVQPEEGIKVNGMEQVIDMLRHADPAFRESLLKRISQRDPQLAFNLRKLFR